MANDNIKDFSINFIMYGLLFLSLSTFTVLFVTNNNIDAIGNDLLNLTNTTSNSINLNLVATEGTANDISNSTSYTNPEASYLGSKDQVATAFKMTGSAKTSFESSKKMLGIVLDDYPVLIAVFSGIVIFSMVYFIIKSFRTGY